MRSGFGVYRPGAEPARHDALLRHGDGAARNAWLAVSGDAISAAAGGVMWWLSREP